MEDRSSLFGIIAIIIGATGLGFGAFSVVNFHVVKGPEGPPGQDGQDGVDGIDGVNGTLDNLVAIWEDLIGPYNLDYLIQVSDIRVNNSKYFYMTNENKYFHLIKSLLFEFKINSLVFEMQIQNSYKKIFIHRCLIQHLNPSFYFWLNIIHFE